MSRAHRQSRQEAVRLLQEFIHHNHQRQAGQGDPAEHSIVLVLERWQHERLKRTYADLRRDPRYGPAVEFFLTDLYGPKTFDLHEHHIEHIYPVMVRLLPADVLETVSRAVEFDVLTRRLDARMVQVLMRDLGVTDGISEETYTKAYRRCGNYDERVRQIELVRIVGVDLDELVRRRWINAALRIARKPAHLAGLGELQDFLERGFAAFRQMRGAHPLLDTIVRRETAILDRIYQSHPRPFEVP